MDVYSAGLAAQLRRQLPLADDDRELGEALDRFELALFQNEPFRSEQLRMALEALLGAGDGFFAAAMRAAALLGESGRERVEALGVLQSLAGRARADAAALDTVRRAIVDTLVHGERLGLVDALDEFLLGVRPRPATALELQAAAR